MPYATEELEGTTFAVYTYVVKEGRAVGTRDVMRGANLSSPSVAYRHLQKLEALGLLEKNEYGEYAVKEKANIRGYLWIGKSLVPRMLLYAFFFMGILVLEVALLGTQFNAQDYQFKVFFFYLALITGAAMVLFLIEGVLLRLRFRPAPTSNHGTE